jgi:hypothetical protein
MLLLPPIFIGSKSECPSNRLFEKSRYSVLSPSRLVNSQERIILLSRANEMQKRTAQLLLNPVFSTLATENFSKLRENIKGGKILY